MLIVIVFVDVLCVVGFMFGVVLCGYGVNVKVLIVVMLVLCVGVVGDELLLIVCCIGVFVWVCFDCVVVVQVL